MNALLKEADQTANYTLPGSAGTTALSITGVRRDFPLVESRLDGSIPARGDLAGWICYRENRTHDSGVLLISGDHSEHEEVWDYEHRLQIMKKKFVPHIVSVKDIVVLNQEANGEAQAPDEKEQAFVLEILQEGARRKASDVHIQVRERSTVVRFRVHGRMQTFWESKTRKEGEAWVTTLFTTMANEQSETSFNDRKDSRAILRPEFAAQVGLTGARIQNRPMKGWMFCVLRLMYEETGEATIESIGFHQDKHLPLLKYLLARTHGIIIVSGATGHGK